MSDPSVPAAPGPAPTRRSVLHALGLAVLTGGGASVVSGCSPDGGSGTPSSSASPVPGASGPTVSSPPDAAPSPSSSSARAPSPSGSAVAVADVPVGGGVGGMAAALRSRS